MAQGVTLEVFGTGMKLEFGEADGNGYWNENRNRPGPHWRRNGPPPLKQKWKPVKVKPTVWDQR